jgi:hypothetical protein
LEAHRSQWADSVQNHRQQALVRQAGSAQRSLLVVLGLQQEDSARRPRRVVSGQNQPQEALVPQEGHLVQQNLRVVHSAWRPRPVVLGRRPQQLALGLQQEDSARVRRRVVSGQNQRQEASVQPQEVHLAQRSLRVVDSVRPRPLAVDSVVVQQAG